MGIIRKGVARATPLKILAQPSIQIHIPNREAKPKTHLPPVVIPAFNHLAAQYICATRGRRDTPRMDATENGNVIFCCCCRLVCWARKCVSSWRIHTNTNTHTHYPRINSRVVREMRSPYIYIYAALCMIRDAPYVKRLLSLSHVIGIGLPHHASYAIHTTTSRTRWGIPQWWRRSHDACGGGKRRMLAFWHFWVHRGFGRLWANIHVFICVHAVCARVLGYAREIWCDVADEEGVFGIFKCCLMKCVCLMIKGFEQTHHREEMFAVAISGCFRMLFV